MVRSRANIKPMIKPMPIHILFLLTLFYVTSIFGARMLLALFALELGAEPLVVGGLTATFSAFPMLLSWPVGRLADRFGARWPLMFGTACAAIGMLTPYFMPGLPALYIAAAMNGLSFAFYNVSAQNLVGVLSPPEQQARNYGNFTLVMSCAFLLGPMFAGFSIDRVGHGIVCLYLSALMLAPMAMLAIWGGALHGGVRSSAPAGSVRDILSDPQLLRLLVTSSLVVAGTELFQFYIPIYGYDIGLSASEIGVVLAAFSAAALVVRLAMPKLVGRFGGERLLAYSFYAGAAGFVLIPFFKSAAALALISFLLGLGMGFGTPITMMLTFSNSAAGRSGEVMGVRLTVNHLTRVVVPIVFSSIGSAFGVFPVFWLNTLLLACGGAFTRRKKTDE